MIDRPKLGDAFRATDLAGLLPPSSPPATDPAPADAPPADRRAGDQTPEAAQSDAGTAQRRPPAEDSAQRRVAAGPPRPIRRSPDPARLVPVSIDMSLHGALRTVSIQTEQTYAELVISSIEEHAAALEERWRSQPAGGAGRLFGAASHSHKARRAEPGVQIQLRLRSSDAAVLDKLVTDWNAPSRSALVNEALRRYLNEHTDQHGA